MIDLDTAAGGAVKYDFDGELVRLEMTDISGYTFAPDEDGEMMSYMRTSASMDRSTSLVYVKVIFKRNEVKDRYVSFIYAVSTGTPRCYPYTNEGDGYAALWVADSRGIYSPKCELVVYNGYEPDDTDSRKFSSFMKSYYQMPYAKLDANFFIQMNDGYKLCYVVAFPELNSSMREVYKGNVGEELYTWLRTLPWSDYYAAIVVESTVGKLQLGNANQYHDMAYVVKLHSDGELPGANAAKIDHTAQIAELQGWFSGKRWSGMNEEELLNMAIEEKDLKLAILAVAPEQINHEDDGTFVRYKTEHCDFLYFAEKDTRIIREARMILHPGTNFALPFDITLDMSPEEALSAMGYTETEIQDLKGANVSQGSFSLRYDGEFLVIQFTDNGAALGIEIGHGANAYIEMG